MKPRPFSFNMIPLTLAKWKKKSFEQVSKEEKLTMIADAGYETAPDILFPETGKKKKTRLLPG